MHRIKEIPLKDYDDLIDIVVNAYPGFGLNSPEDRQRQKKNMIAVRKADHNQTVMGLYRSKKLLGVMRMHDFVMNVFGNMLPTGGVGLVAVHLAHKKEKICKELIEYYLEHYRKLNYPLATLYPFRPDFYRKMGFGYGIKHNEYRILPEHLPKSPGREQVELVTKPNLKALTECYNRMARKTHGMIEKCVYEWRWATRNAARIAVYKDGRTILGYIVFSFKKVRQDQFIINDLVIEEFVYENRDVFLGLMAFLQSQADQVRRVIFNTQDEFLQFLPFDARDGSLHNVGRLSHQCNLQGLGIMYRVINVREFFARLKEHNFNDITCRLKIDIRDTFVKTNHGQTIVHFDHGQPTVKNAGDYDLTISLDISEFSSLVMGTVDFNSLYRYGLAEISDNKHLETVNRLFHTTTRPDTTTQF